MMNIALLKFPLPPVCRGIIVAAFFATDLCGQNITPRLPQNIDRNHKYLFYLHGGIVQEQGEDAVSKTFGKYEYRKILQTLHAKGFHVISEVRAKGTSELEYAAKVSLQIDTLEAAGVPLSSIVVVGASLGAYIALEVALMKKDPSIRYVLIGLCSDYAISHFSKPGNVFFGKFLSIYENTDSKGTCQSLFTAPANHGHFSELELNMGTGHGFLFKPYKEWVDPLVEWTKQ